MVFTDSKLRSLRSKKERFIIWEDGKTGLGVRVSPTGRKSFVYMYRYQNTARMMTMGTYPQIGLASARLKAAQAKGLLSRGTDPGKLWVEVKAKEREAETIRNLADEYLEKWAKPRKRSWREDERILDYDVLPVWGKKKAKDVRRKDVIKLLDMIVARQAPIMANRTLAVIRGSGGVRKLRWGGKGRGDLVIDHIRKKPSGKHIA
ncbi:MAG: tyrosine-type recombinase/integrase [Nitrospinota bacterium]